MLGFTALSEAPLASTPSAAAAGAYTITGSAATIQVVGQTATLRAARVVAASPATITVAGQTATLRVSRAIVASPATIAVTGQTAQLRAARTIAASPATINVAGQTATLRAGRNIAASPATIVIAGQTATLTYVPAAGAYTITGSPATITISGGSGLLTYTAAVTQGGGVSARRRRRRAPQYRTIDSQREWLALLRDLGVITADTPAPEAPPEPETLDDVDDWQDRIAARYARVETQIAELQARANQKAARERLLEEQTTLRQVASHLAAVQARIVRERDDEDDLLLLAA